LYGRYKIHPRTHPSHKSDGDKTTETKQRRQNKTKRDSDLKDEDDDVVLTTATDMNGSYIFEDLPPGNYKISHDLPEGFIITEEGDDYPDGDEYNNGEIVCNNIGARVYTGQVDSENNFIDSELGSITGSAKDSANNVFYGVLVCLKDEDGNAIFSTTVIDNNGIYSFTSLMPGDYTIVQENHNGYNDVSDQDKQVDGDNVDSNKILDNSIGVSWNAGETYRGKNFVDEKVGAVSGSVMDSSGMQLRLRQDKCTKH